MASVISPTARASQRLAPGRSAAQGRVVAGATAPAPLAVLPRFYQALSTALGPMHWWPARTPFEVIAGAILTQNTAWANVERAIANLRRERLLSARALERVPAARLARLVRPSGYFRQKAKKLKAFARFLHREYGGSLAAMFRTPTPELRERLLGVHGIGPETADSILLYVGNHPVFVVDAYTKRILERHGLVSAKAGYEEVRAAFEASLLPDPQLYNEYHALLVNAGKNWCRTQQPRCTDCPLGPFLSLGPLPGLKSLDPVPGLQSARLAAEMPSPAALPAWPASAVVGAPEAER